MMEHLSINDFEKRYEVEQGIKHWLLYRQANKENTPKMEDAMVINKFINELVEEVADSSEMGELPWETINREDPQEFVKVAV